MYKRIVCFLIFISLNMVFLHAQTQKEKPCGMKKGQKTGTCKSFFSNGKTQFLQNWKEGKLEGEAIYYFDNGQIKAIGNNKKNGKIGEWKHYNEKGILIGIEHFVYRDNMSLKEGEFKFFSPSGKLQEIDLYFDDVLEGESIGYHENGEISGIGNFVKGEKQGEWKQYNEKGQLIKTDMYKDGALLKMKAK